MKPKLPRPEHYSYLQYRRQRNLQIILPLAASALLVLAALAWIIFAAFQSGGDVSRWAAVSAIWLSVPTLLCGLIPIALLGALIYGMARALSVLPHYTGIVQDYVYVARSRLLRGANSVSAALIEVEGFAARVKSFFQRIVP